MGDGRGRGREEMNGRVWLLAWAAALLFASPGLAYAAEQVRPRTISDIAALLDQYKPDPALVEQNRAKARAEPPAALAGRELAVFLLDRSEAAGAIGDSRSQIADLRRAVQATSDSQDIFAVQMQNSLATALIAAGNLSEAARQLQAITPPQNAACRFVALHANLSEVHARLGDADGVRASVKVAEARYPDCERGKNPVNRDEIGLYRANLNHSRAQLLILEGRHDAAEVAYRRALADVVEETSAIEGRIERGLVQKFQTPEFARNRVARNYDARERALAVFLAARNRL